MPGESSFKQLARNALIPSRLHLPLFLLVALQFAIHRTMSGNEIDTLQAARRFADPRYIPGDWFLGQPPGPRLPFQWLIWPLTATLPLVPLAIVGRILGFWLLTGAVARLLGRLGLRAGEAVLAMALFLWLGQSLFAGEWLFGQFETKVFAYAFVLFAIDAAADTRLRTAALRLGAATTLHVFVGGWATFAVALALLTLRPPVLWRTVAEAVLLAFLAALPGLLYTLAVTGAHQPSPVDFAWIYVDLRAPHHLLPTTWSAPRQTWIIGLTLLAGLASPQVLWPNRADVRLMARVTLATLVPCLLGVAAAILPQTHRFLATYPFRVGASLLLLLGLPLVLVPLLRGLPLFLQRLAHVGVASVYV